MKRKVCAEDKSCCKRIVGSIVVHTHVPTAEDRKFGNSIATTLFPRGGLDESLGAPLRQPRRALLGHKERVFDCATRPTLHTSTSVPPGSFSIATASEDGTARIWDVMGTTAQAPVSCIHTLRGHKAEVLRVAWAPTGTSSSGDLVCTGSADGSARLWCLPPQTSAAPPPEANQETKTQGVGGALSSVKGKKSPAPETKAPAAATCAVSLAHGKDAQVYSCGFIPETSFLITAAESTVRCWDLRVGSSSEEPTSAWSYDSIGRTTPYGGAQRNPNNENFVFDIRVSPPATGGVNRLFAAALSDGTARVSAGLHAGGVSPTSVADLSLNDGVMLSAIEWSPDGRSLAASRGDGSLLIWDSRTWKCRAVLAGAHSRPCYGSVFHPHDPALLLSWSSDGTIALWDSLRTERPEPIHYGLTPHQADSPSYPILRCAWSPDGRSLVVAGGDGSGSMSFLGVPVWLVDLVT